MKHFILHINKDLKKHNYQFFLLFFTSLFFLSLFILLKGNPISQFFTISGFIIFYIIWGIAHHFLDKTLHFKVVVEYILLGASALFLFGILLI